MKCLPMLILVLAAVSGGGGVTQESGLSQFWTDDYKIFEQIYGRTSDRDIYRGAQNPNTNTFNSDIRKFQQRPNEYTEDTRRINDEETSASQHQPYLGYSNLLAQQQYKTEQEYFKPAKPTYKFIGYNEYKPISQTTDAETYNYLKHLELLAKQKSVAPPEETVAYKPYAGVQNPEETEAYKSIQDILDAHETKQSKEKNKDEKVKYVTYNQSRPTKKPNYRYVSDVSRPSRCTGRCKKRLTYSSPRYRLRPVIIKHRIINED